MNPGDKPFVSKISNPSNAIYCSPAYGPIFGAGHDIHIEDNANVSKSNYVSFDSYEQPVDRAGDDCILTDSHNFQVKEIEVFQIKI